MNIALVTGTTQGIGFTLTELLLQNEFTVIGLSRHVHKTELFTNNYPGQFSAYPCDIRNPQQIRSIFQTIEKKYPYIDLLVNNAGVGYFEPLESTTDEHWQATIETNLSGPFYITRAALALLKKSSQPYIMNICSTASRKGFVHCTAYSASKFGLYGMTEVWREELRASKIRVSAIIPGPVYTPFWNQFDHSFDTAAMMPSSAVAHAILWLFRQSPDHVIEEIIIKPPQGDF